MMQGDAYKIPLEITTADGPANDRTFSDIEVFIGKLRFSMSDGRITYDAQEKKFMVAVTQKETFRLIARKQPVQVRVKTALGEVVGVSAGEIDVEDAISQVVL